MSQLKRLNHNIRYRQRNLDVWLNNLDSEKFFVNFNREGNSNFSLPLILIEKDLNLLKKVCKLLDNIGVEYRVGTAGGGSQARQPYLEKYDFITYDLTNVNHIHDFGLYVGNHPELLSHDIETLCRKLNNV